MAFGTEACWRYTVSADDVTLTYWFAKSRAGMPVQVEERVDGELDDGRRLLETR